MEIKIIHVDEKEIERGWTKEQIIKELKEKAKELEKEYDCKIKQYVDINFNW